MPEYLHDGFMSGTEKSHDCGSLELSGEHYSTEYRLSWLALIFARQDRDLVGKRLCEKLFCSTTLQPGALEVRFKPFFP